MPQRHRDINVTDAAGINHILGKYIAATSIAKLKVRRMSGIKQFRLCYCYSNCCDIKVTDAAGINHIGKEHCKTESKADECNQTPGYSQFLLFYCPVSNIFWYLLFFNVVCVFVFSIIQIISAFLFVFGSKTIWLTYVMVKW